MLTRFILWRLVALAAVLTAVEVGLWAFGGGPGRLLRGDARGEPSGSLAHLARAFAWVLATAAVAPLLELFVLALSSALAVLVLRVLARRRRRYVRLRVVAYRTDETTLDGVVATLESLHRGLLRRSWQRALLGQESLALEVHCGACQPGARTAQREAWLAVSVPRGTQDAVQAALRGAYPNCALESVHVSPGSPPCLLRLRKRTHFIRRAKAADRDEHERSPAMNRLMTAMGACAGAAYVQVALTPVPAWFERYAAAAYKRHERSTRPRGTHPLRAPMHSLYDEAELKGGLYVQHRPLFFTDLRVVADDRASARRIAAELRAQGAENHLVERHVRVPERLLSAYEGRLARGEGGFLPPMRKGVFAPTELAALWHLPSVDFSTVPFARPAVPFAPAPPTIHRPREGAGLLHDALGPISIHEQCRRGNVAVPGTVEQGKTSLLVASVAEDLRRDRCSIVLLDPKGDATDAALSAVPRERTCTLLDFARPTCGFNPLAASAPPDVVADYVVAALRNLFSEADIRASSDRYLRNAVIAVLANDRNATLWDAARLLSVGQDGYAYRAHVGARVRGMPELKEISEFFTAELAAQLADARSPTTAKLDAPANKLARLLNSASTKRILRNAHLAVDFDRVISGSEVLIVRGALGSMGQGNTAVLMQLLLGMLDAALARQQDQVDTRERVAVALKIDEAPLVINRGFAQTLALKRSAGLETVACWQTDSQWVDRDIRDQLDALFAHRVYFATASVHDARASASLLMSEFSDSVRPGVRNLSALGRPDTRMHLPKHHALVSLTTPTGRERPFLARTIPMRVDPARIAHHAHRQASRGARYLEDLREPHWESAVAEHRAWRGRVDPPAGGSIGRAARAPDSASAGRPSIPPASYRELVGIDGAGRARIVPVHAGQRTVEPDPLDLRILAFVASFRYVLSTQIHRRYNDGRAQTTTQRRLKRLADARLLARLQFHRADGAGTPICYAITDPGIAELRRASTSPAADAVGPPTAPVLPRSREEVRRVAQVRHELHVTGWVLALESALGERRLTLKGAAESSISPLTRAARDTRRALGVRDLRLPGGRTPHDFWQTTVSGERVEVERFETVRPDATVRLSEHVDLLVECDDRLPRGPDARKLERYDHLISGWAMHTKAYGRRRGRPPRSVFVCRDRERARECARHADAVLLACHAYPGQYPAEWEYPGRREIVFAAERDAHDRSLHAYRLQPLPPDVRVACAGGDPSARLAEPETTELV